jgi:hypothetical protein
MPVSEITIWLQLLFALVEPPRSAENSLTVLRRRRSRRREALDVERHPGGAQGDDLLLRDVRRAATCETWPRRRCRAESGI